MNGNEFSADAWRHFLVTQVTSLPVLYKWYHFLLTWTRWFPRENIQFWHLWKVEKVLVCNTIDWQQSQWLDLGANFLYSYLVNVKFLCVKSSIIIQRTIRPLSCWTTHQLCQMACWWHACTLSSIFRMGLVLFFEFVGVPASQTNRMIMMASFFFYYVAAICTHTLVCASGISLFMTL